MERCGFSSGDFTQPDDNKSGYCEQRQQDRCNQQGTLVSLILPEKFNYTSKKDSDWDRAIFTVNKNDPTALKMRGVRFYMTDYDIESTNLLVRGLKYTVRVPVYNASFKDTGPFSVRLSLAEDNDFDAPKTTVGEVRFANIAGWGNGNSRQFAEFVWSPDIAAGEYYLFVDIDPGNELDEVHENRRSADGTMIDSGGCESAGGFAGLALIGVMMMSRKRK